jgi:hypothetical protein
MNDFMPRTGPVALVVSAVERIPAVRAISSTETTRSRTEAGTALPSRVTDRSTAAADYAQLQADIAEVIARIEPASSKASDTVEAADRALIALMPKSVVMLPMPPTDAKIVAFVAQVAQSVARQAAQTRAAQANATPFVVEAAAG